LNKDAYAKQSYRMMDDLHESGVLRTFLLSMEKDGRLVNADKGDVSLILSGLDMENSLLRSRIPRVVLKFFKGEDVWFVGDLYHAGGKWTDCDETNLRLHAYFNHMSHQFQTNTTIRLSDQERGFLEPQPGREKPGPKKKREEKK
jgi:hypothetical protein